MSTALPKGYGLPVEACRSCGQMTPREPLRCPTCDRPAVAEHQGCALRDSICPDGHRFFKCFRHGRTVPGELDHAKVRAVDQCVCDGVEERRRRSVTLGAALAGRS